LRDKAKEIEREQKRERRRRRKAEEQRKKEEERRKNARMERRERREKRKKRDYDVDSRQTRTAQDSASKRQKTTQNSGRTTRSSTGAQSHQHSRPTSVTHPVPPSYPTPSPPPGPPSGPPPTYDYSRHYSTPVFPSPSAYLQPNVYWGRYDDPSIYFPPAPPRAPPESRNYIVIDDKIGTEKQEKHPILFLVDVHFPFAGNLVTKQRGTCKENGTKKVGGLGRSRSLRWPEGGICLTLIRVGT
jgi:hypothetical protein